MQTPTGIAVTARAMTKEECRESFLRRVRSIVKYWQHESSVSREDAIRGVVFSVCVLLDGGSGLMPAFNISPNPHPDDEPYHKSEGTNWWPSDLIFNDDCSLHDLL